MSREFYETRKMFRSHLMYDHPYTFDEWNNIPEDLKAAALFVQYFDTILFAYTKAKLSHADEEACVETVLQYLVKNVPIISDNPKKFTPNYIYRISYNCIRCVQYGQVDVDRTQKTTSDIISTDDGDISVYDLHVDTSTEKEYDLDDKRIKAMFWAAVDSDQDAHDMVEHILNSKTLRFQKARREAALEYLRKNLEEFKVYYYND